MHQALSAAQFPSGYTAFFGCVTTTSWGCSGEDKVALKYEIPISKGFTFLQALFGLDLRKDPDFEALILHSLL
jgi:hypothetical protein